MKYTFKILLLLFVFTSVKVYCQTSLENWVAVYSDKEKTTYVNVTGLSSFQNDEIMVWVMEEMSSALKMEEIEDNIYKAKYYYMISKSLKRYSIVDIIYYNEKGNVCRTYHYSHDYDNQEFKYTSPIMAGSEMERIFQQCSNVINPENSSK